MREWTKEDLKRIREKRKERKRRRRIKYFKKTLPIFIISIICGGVIGATIAVNQIPNNSHESSKTDPVVKTLQTNKDFSIAAKQEKELSPRKEIYFETITEVEYTDKELLSEHSISYGHPVQDRDTNLKVACAAISGEEGLILDPGDVFDWEKVVGDTTPDKGYQKGYMFVNQKSVLAYGGGICQVATTLNSAAIKAGMKTDSQTHSKKPAYLSADDYEATIAHGQKNLKVMNTLDYPVRIKMWTEEDTVYAEIYKLDKEEKRIVFKEMTAKN